MRRDTKIRSITRLLEVRSAADTALHAAAAAAHSVGSAPTAADAAAAAADAWAAATASRLADDGWRAAPKPQRDYATAAHSLGLREALAACRLGGDYSGGTTHRVSWGAAPSAGTTTDSGERYSRGCTWRKTDATHSVTISPEGVVDLLDSPALRAESSREGLPLISYTADTGAAVWVEARNKRLVAVAGWVCAVAGTIYHSTESADHARRGATRKAAAVARSAAAARADARASRRARLVVRLCRGATATVADALAMGFCAPGIRAWQERHGVGDSATLADLVRTGDPAATRLALDLARRVRRAAAVTA